MKTPLQTLRSTALAVTLAVSAMPAGTAGAASTEETVKLLTANFPMRQVVQVEVGDFRFKPGQVAPVHTHEAPAIGYVSKGMIIYQVEGGKPQILRAGDAFFEPVGTRILRFDNASATEAAHFLDFNLEQANEPFIVFEKKPSEAIDRRPLPTVKLAGIHTEKVEVFTNRIDADGTIILENTEPTLGLVAEGVIELRVTGRQIKRLAAGQTFALPTAGSKATIVNKSAEVPANVITLRIH
ncbi:cupin domain-containing protein [Anderseniella sp. Alg231-50]|uniref:cupin domain-containing protein n=1 Tax=Anderseniella sp. Alg231-50 TaxID=1922226 RepID=UPI00307B5987